MQLNKFLISETASLRDALLLIEINHHGIILTTGPTGAVTGLATDGDIRRKLLESGSLDDAIALCANAEFVWEDSATTRELLMKKLDHRIRGEARRARGRKLHAPERLQESPLERYSKADEQGEVVDPL